MFWRKPEPEPTIGEQLLEARAKLARVKKLPEESFTIPGPFPPQTLRHGIDEKPKRIAELEAEVAYLEVKLEKTDDK